jgi:hypothetical protein
MDTFVMIPTRPIRQKSCALDVSPKTIFDETKLSVVHRRPKTTTYGRKVLILAIFNCAKLRRFQLDMLRAAHL